MGMELQNCAINGRPIAAGYLRIDRISGSKREGAMVYANVYASFAAAQEFGAYPFEQLMIPLPWPEDDTRIEQALYPQVEQWLKDNATIGTIQNILVDPVMEKAPEEVDPPPEA